jgi:pimeloyl-ACP methyl ester carboxylesterase
LEGLVPVARIRDANINYEVLGERGPWVVLTPGGRGALEMVKPLGSRLAGAGYRVVLHDRRNCGASDVVIGGAQSEQEIWADDVHELLSGLGALPVIAGGGSAGCRLSLLLTLRHPGSTRALLLWWVTGGPVAAERLAYNYYGQFIEAAERGGMTAVCETEFFRERIERNPANRERLLAMPPREFVAVMSRWREFFLQGAALPVIGADEERLRSIDVPACIVPGGDEVHPRHVGEGLARLLPSSELCYLWTEDEQRALATRPLPEVMQERQARLAKVYLDFLRRGGLAPG